MATLESIGKAKATGLILSTVLGVEPKYEYHDNYVRVYYPSTDLPAVRAKVNEIATGPAGDVRIDWLPLTTPIAIKTVLPVAVGLIAAGFLIGRLSAK